MTEGWRQDQTEPQRQRSAGLLSDAELAALPLEPFPSAAARYGAGVVGLLGVGAVLSVIFDGFLDSLGWGGGVSTALMMSGFFGWQEEGSPHGPFRRRRMLPFVIGSLVVFYASEAARLAAGWDVAKPSSTLLLIAGGAGIVLFGLAQNRFSSQIRKRARPTPPWRQARAREQ